MRNLILLMALMFFVPSAQAADITLAWDPSSSEDVEGYKLYYGNESGSYGQPVDVGNVLTYTITGLAPGNTWYFAATAYRGENESGFSNEVFTTIPLEGFTVLAQACASNWYGVVCLVTTSENAKATFQYRKLGTSDDWMIIIATPTPWKTEHRAIVYFEQDLGEYYEYTWTLENAEGNILNGSGTFLTK